MKRLILIRAGRTDWVDQERLAGDMDLPINEVGRKEASLAADAIRAMSPRTIYCGTDGPASQTAEQIAASLGLKFKALDSLREMDLGLWEGLTEDQFRERFSRVHKAWHDDPSSVEPPNGESLPLVEARLEQAFFSLLKKRATSPIVIVLGRLAYSAVRCRFHDRLYEQFWEYVDEPVGPCLLDATPQVIRPAHAAS
ncbi:MAG: histidine phosphatase family protein [Phycisphaerae bacterium]|nr:histidine phosphatase family protein [Phycisphaerae bacterium]